MRYNIIICAAPVFHHIKRQQHSLSSADEAFRGSAIKSGGEFQNIPWNLTI